MRGCPATLTQSCGRTEKSPSHKLLQGVVFCFAAMPRWCRSIRHFRMRAQLYACIACSMMPAWLNLPATGIWTMLWASSWTELSRASRRCPLWRRLQLTRCVSCRGRFIFSYLFVMRSAPREEQRGERGPRKELRCTVCHPRPWRKQLRRLSNARFVGISAWPSLPFTGTLWPQRF